MLLPNPHWNEEWHMTQWERSTLIQLLQNLKPDVSLEIGTFRCGSLRPISHYSRRVYTFDVDPNQHRIASLFPTVKFITGNSADTLPPIIASMNESEEEVNFILVDGSHEVDGVCADISACLKYRPKRKPTVIVMHDSSNPKVRRGIEISPWDDCPFVHELDLDLCPGALYDRSDIPGEIWGGLAAALLLPTARSGPITRRASFQYTREAMLRSSSYPDEARW
ncbi:class I SAM-dependent methyltransferase [Methylobacterium sp. 092160098-2]|uniref:class I SAM-dependent methyltransferase n=1 Tax=Methylobacterium sp. 092160098-2 TaxID=3025129 RepID=UPI00406C2718